MRLLTKKSLFRAATLLTRPFRAAAPPAPQLPNGLETIVVPAARDRWRFTRVGTYDPTLIESVLNGVLAGQPRAQWELFDLMEDTSPRLSKALNELKRNVIALDWQVSAWAPRGGKPSPAAQEKAAFCDQLIWSMRPVPAREEENFEGAIYATLDGWAKGISVQEIDWERRAGAIAPRAMRWIHPQYYQFPYTGAELMLDMDQVQTSRSQALASPNANPASAPLRFATASQFVPFPENKFVIGISKQKTGPALSGALLRPLAWWWCIANFSAEWLVKFAQRFGMPIRWATYDPTRKDLLTKILDMLQNLGDDAFAAFPQGTQLQLIEAAKNAADNPQILLLQMYDRLVDLLILNETLTSDVGTAGSRAAATVHESIRADVIQSAANYASGTLNQLLRSICVLNYGNDDECPYFTAGRKDAEDAKAMADRDAVLVGQVGMDLPKTWLYERHGVPAPQPGDEVITGRTSPPPQFNPFAAATFNGPERSASPANGEPMSPPASTPLASADRMMQAKSGADAAAAADSPADEIARRKAAVLAAAYKGSLAPVRRIILAARSAEEAQAELQKFFADWNPAKVAAITEEALQLCAAAADTAQ